MTCIRKVPIKSQDNVYDSIETIGGIKMEDANLKVKLIKSLCSEEQKTNCNSEHDKNLPTRTFKDGQRTIHWHRNEYLACNPYTVGYHSRLFYSTRRALHFGETQAFQRILGYLYRIIADNSISADLAFFL